MDRPPRQKFFEFLPPLQSRGIFTYSVVVLAIRIKLVKNIEKIRIDSYGVTNCVHKLNAALLLLQEFQYE